jgi:hypothetical protein
MQARPGTDSAIFRLGLQGLRPADCSGRDQPVKSVDRTTRNPTFLFLLFTLFLLR